MDLLPGPVAHFGTNRSVGINVDRCSTIPGKASHHALVLGERCEPLGGGIACAALWWDWEALPDGWNEPDHGGRSDRFIRPPRPRRGHRFAIGCKSIGKDLSRQAERQARADDQIVSRAALGFKRDDPAAGVRRIDKAGTLCQFPGMQAKRLTLEAKPVADAPERAVRHEPAMRFEGGVKFV